jgi:hypothetical protein
MDRIVFSGCLLLVSFGILLGFGMSTTEVAANKIRGVFEILSYAGTVVTAMVAVVALTSWQSQFRHTERFKSLKDLKDAAIGLHAFKDFLLTVQKKCHHLICNDGYPIDVLEQDETLAREKWLIALEAYNRAWGTAVVFFTHAEEASFSGSAKVFTSRSINDPLRIVMAYANQPNKDQLVEFTKTSRQITDEAKYLCKSTVSELEWMLRQKYKA